MPFRVRGRVGSKRNTTDLSGTFEVIALRRPAADAQITAICLVEGATLATRNNRDFEMFGLNMVNPWTA